MSAYDRYYQCIQDLQLSQLRSRLIWLSSSTKSTPIMTALRHRFDSGHIDESCVNPFDVLYIRIAYKRLFALDLAVLYRESVPGEIVSALYGEKEFSGDNAMTFTELKKTKIQYWQDIDKERSVKSMQLNESMSLRLWERPYNLYAVTEYDKDFRKEWKDGFLEYEGNNYGDTSDFYIIGSVHRQDN